MSIVSKMYTADTVYKSGKPDSSIQTLVASVVDTFWVGSTSV